MCRGLSLLAFGLGGPVQEALNLGDRGVLLSPLRRSSVAVDGVQVRLAPEDTPVTEPGSRSSGSTGAEPGVDWVLTGEANTVVHSRPFCHSQPEHVLGILLGGNAGRWLVLATEDGLIQSGGVLDVDAVVVVVSARLSHASTNGVVEKMPSDHDNRGAISSALADGFNNFDARELIVFLAGVGGIDQCHVHPVPSGMA